MRERRTTIRVPVGLEATYQVLEEVLPPRLGMSEDLSQGGMRLSQPEHLETGKKISVTLIFPKEGEVNLKGTVVWCRETREEKGYESGIEWSEISPVSQARLSAFLTGRTRTAGYAQPGIFQPDETGFLRAIRWGLIGSALLCAIGFFWLSRGRLSAENRSLKAQNQFYEQQIDSLLTRASP